jgi:hypothetical protein
MVTKRVYAGSIGVSTAYISRNVLVAVDDDEAQARVVLTVDEAREFVRAIEAVISELEIERGVSA